MIKMTSLITGGSGFFGTNLAKKLLEKCEEVIIYDLVEPSEEIANKVEFIRGDILDRKKMKESLKNVDFVYHTAALVPLSKAGKKFMIVNAEGTRSVVEAALDKGVKKFVHISSSAVYAIDKMPITEESPVRPFTQYGKAKYAAELVVMEYMNKGLDAVIIRPRTIVDENRAGIFQILFDWVYEGRTIYVVGDGNNLFQLISASDLSEACYLAAKTKKSSGKIINIGNEEYGTINDLILYLISYAKSRSRIKHINAFFAVNLLRILDILDLSPLADWHYLTLDKPFYFDISLAKKLLNWKPKDSNNEMIRRSYDWYVANKHEVDAKKGTTHRTSPKQKILGLLKLIS